MLQTMSCQGQKLSFAKVISATLVQLPGTVFCLICMISLTLTHSKTTQGCTFWSCLFWHLCGAPGRLVERCPTNLILYFLLRPRERLRSIVMSTSVSMCLCVCPRRYIRNNTRDLYQFFVHVAYGRGSVLLRQRCDTLCTSGFVMTSFFCYIGPYSGMIFAT